MADGCDAASGLGVVAGVASAGAGVAACANTSRAVKASAKQVVKMIIFSNRVPRIMDSVSAIAKFPIACSKGLDPKPSLRRNNSANLHSNSVESCDGKAEHDRPSAKDGVNQNNLKMS